jgi:hypothetical protein
MNDVQQQKPDKITLSNDINVITAEINAYRQIAGEAIFEIGRRLKYVKENDLAHGEFGKWLKESVDMTHQHANKFMKVAEALSDGNYASMSNLGIAALYEIATLRPEERERTHTIPSTGESKTVDEMTVRELREVKKALREKDVALKEAQERASKAESDYEMMRDTIESIREQEPRVEYVHVNDEIAEQKLRKYEELFGDVSIYSNNVRRVGNDDAITYAVFEFSEDMRKLIEKYGYLTHFTKEFNTMISDGKQEYRKSIGAMKQFLTQLEKALEDDVIIINQ